MQFLSVTLRLLRGNQRRSQGVATGGPGHTSGSWKILPRALIATEPWRRSLSLVISLVPTPLSPLNPLTPHSSESSHNFFTRAAAVPHLNHSSSYATGGNKGKDYNMQNGYSFTNFSEYGWFKWHKNMKDKSTISCIRSKFIFGPRENHSWVYWVWCREKLDDYKACYQGSQSSCLVEV